MSQPILHQSGPIIQQYGEMRSLGIVLDETSRQASVDLLNPILADTMILTALYKKMHWHMRGPTFIALHKMLDDHYTAQAGLTDLIAERIQTLGGVCVGDPRLAAELTSIPRAPDGVEEVPAMLSRLLEAHAHVITKVRAGIDVTSTGGDWGTNDMLMSDVLRTNEFQCWFVAEHLVDVPTTRI